MELSSLNSVVEYLTVDVIVVIRLSLFRLQQRGTFFCFNNYIKANNNIYIEYEISQQNYADFVLQLILLCLHGSYVSNIHLYKYFDINLLNSASERNVHLCFFRSFLVLLWTLPRSFLVLLFIIYYSGDKLRCLLKTPPL